MKSKRTSPLAIWSRLAVTTGEMLLASANVIHHRTQRMAKASVPPNPRDRREFSRMVKEKGEAARDSAQAMTSQIIKLNQQLGKEAMRQMLVGAADAMAVVSSKTPAQALARQAKLQHSLKKSAAAATKLSKATALVAQKGLRPIHARATANSKRLGQLK